MSAAPPFAIEDCPALYGQASAVISRYYPWAEVAYREQGWTLPRYIDRVYVVEKATRLLDYRPHYNLPSMFNPDG